MANSSIFEALLTNPTATEQTYTGTATWDGTPPSSTTTHTYEWAQLGKLVFLRINLKYASAGSTNTTVTMTLPSDCPTPEVPTGFSAAGTNMFKGEGAMGTTASLTTTTLVTRSYLRSNAGNTGYVLTVYTSGGGVAAVVAYATIIYIAA